MSELVLELKGTNPPESIHVSSIPFSIGRARGNDLVLDHPEISARHALIDRTESGFVLRDLGSAHGTYVRGRRIVEHRLAALESVQIGGKSFELIMSPAPMTSPSKLRHPRKPQRQTVHSALTCMGAFALMLTAQAWSRAHWSKSITGACFASAVGLTLGIVMISRAAVWFKRRGDRQRLFRRLVVSLSTLAFAVTVWPPLQSLAIEPLPYLPLRVSILELATFALAGWAIASIVSSFISSWSRQARRWALLGAAVASMSLLHLYSQNVVVLSEPKLESAIWRWPSTQLHQLSQAKGRVRTQLERSLDAIDSLRKNVWGGLALQGRLTSVQHAAKLGSDLGAHHDSTAPAKAPRAF